VDYSQEKILNELPKQRNKINPLKTNQIYQLEQEMILLLLNCGIPGRAGH